jgi:hypothetical protein
MTLLDLEYKPLYVTLWAGITETHLMAPISVDGPVRGAS